MSAPPELPRLMAAIGLNEILESREPELAAAGGAHDALGDGLAEAIGIADREHDIAHAQGIRAAHGHDGQLVHGQMQNGNIRVGVLTDDGRIGDAAVRNLHSNGISARDDVLIRHDGPGRVDDDAGPQAALDTLSIARPKIAEQLVERGRLGALRHQTRGIDVDHGRRRSRDRVGKARHDHRRTDWGGRRVLRRNGGLSQECGLPPDHEKCRREGRPPRP